MTKLVLDDYPCGIGVYVLVLLVFCVTKVSSLAVNVDQHTKPYHQMTENISSNVEGVFYLFQKFNVHIKLCQPTRIYKHNAACLQGKQGRVICKK